MAKKAPNLRHFAKKCKRFIYFEKTIDIKIKTC